MTNLALKTSLVQVISRFKERIIDAFVIKKTALCIIFKREKDERIREQVGIESTCNVAGYIMIEQCTTQ